MAVRLSVLRAGRHLPPGRFLVLIPLKGCVDPRDIMWLEGLSQLKKSYDLIGYRTRDLPASSIMPQPTTLPRTHCLKSSYHEDVLGSGGIAQPLTSALI
jgi:hypothetical protein